MATLERLRGRLHELVDDFVRLSRQAEAAREREKTAVICIQKACRGYLLRKYLRRLELTVICIQKCWRGYKGRERFRHFRQEDNRRRREEHFATSARDIQRWWRGFYSRKYVHDFHARKAYLLAVHQKNEEVRRQLEAEYEEAVRRMEQEAQEAAEQRCREFMRSRHHLLSTVQRPGVFAAPACSAKTLASGPLRVMLGDAAVEEQMRTLNKQQVREFERQRAGKLPVLPEPLGHRPTLRCSTSYGERKQREALEKVIGRLQILEHHDMPFLNVTRCQEPFLKVMPNSCLEEFTDSLVRQKSAQLRGPFPGDSKRKFSTAVQCNREFDEYLSLRAGLIKALH